MPSGKLPAVDTERQWRYFRVRMRQPGRFKQCRVPEWATKVANSVSSGAKVVMCQSPKTRKWYVQSVMIQKGYGKTARDALRLAKIVKEKIET